MASHAVPLSDKEKAVPSSYPAPLGRHDGLGTETDSASAIAEMRELARASGTRPAFYAKVNVLNRAISEIGMGRYQWELFVTAGFGWAADNLCECLGWLERSDSRRREGVRRWDSLR